MTFEQFKSFLTDPQPPATVSPILQALWYDANEQWEPAHEIAQSREGTPAFDRLHAYLHRKEGDQFNAGYWYRRAGSPVFRGSLTDEWTQLVQQELTH